MKSYPGTAIAHRFFSGTAASYDRVVNLCTVGADLWWKRRILNALAGRPRRIIDLACGTGILTFKLSYKFPRAHIIGIDLHADYIDVAQKKMAALNRTNVEFIVGRAEDILLNDSVDCITSSYLAKYAEPAGLVSNAEKMLRNQGILLIHDFIYPTHLQIAKIWEIYFRLLQSLGARLFPAWKTVFDELPSFVRGTRWPLEFTRILRRHAFSDIGFTTMTFGTSAMITCKKASSPTGANGTG